MKRRNMILGAGALLAGGVGLAGSETNLLSGEPSDVFGATASAGELSFNTNGITTVAWRQKSSSEAWLRANYASTAPDWYRLHRPDGRSIWEVDDPTGDSDERAFSLPISNIGTWELAVGQGGSQASLQLPISNQFTIDTFALNADTLHIGVSNQTKSPNFLENFYLTHAKTGAGKKYMVNQAVMPGESFTLAKPYPYDYYKSVELRVVSGPVKDFVSQTKDFV